MAESLWNRCTLLYIVVHSPYYPWGECTMYMVQAMGESIQGPSSPFIRDAAAAPIGHVSAYLFRYLPVLERLDWFTLLEDQGGF